MLDFRHTHATRVQHAVGAFTLLLLVAVPARARCGKERWHLKTGIDPMIGAVKLGAPIASTIAKLVTIPRSDITKNVPEDERFPPIERPTTFRIDDIAVELMRMKE